jgi:hypothetical protein
MIMIFLAGLFNHKVCKYNGVTINKQFYLFDHNGF